MPDETNQGRGLEFIRTLPDDQLRDLRKAASQEMKRRGMKGEKGKGGRKGKDEDDDSED